MIYRRQVANETSYNFRYQSLTTKEIRNNINLKHLIISLVTKIRIRKEQEYEQEKRNKNKNSKNKKK
jgi:hypothetical protein